MTDAMLSDITPTLPLYYGAKQSNKDTYVWHFNTTTRKVVPQHTIRVSSKYIILHLLLSHTASGRRTQTYSTAVTLHYWPPLLHNKQWLMVSPTSHSARYSQLLVFIHTVDEFRCIGSIHTFHVTIHTLYAVGM